MNIHVDDVSKCLDIFASLLNCRYLVKVEYKAWRKFARAEQIELDFDSMNKVYVHATQSNGTVFTTTFATNDNGFGQYLFDYYYNKEAYMDTLNTTKIDSTCYTDSTLNTNWNEYTTAGTVSYDWLKNIPVTITYSEPTKKEENNMNTNKMFNFDFGPCGDIIRMSMYGLAVKNQAGEWVSYDSNNGEIVNVDVFNIAEGGKWFYKMPVSVDDVAVGDLLIHSKKPCYVVDFNENTLNPIVIDIFNMERKEILLQKSCFGFSFATKVISLFDGLGGEKPTAKNPFDNMWMLALLSGENRVDDMMLPLMMMNGQMDMSNPLMMYFMMKDGKNSDALPLILMMNQQQKK